MMISLLRGRVRENQGLIMREKQLIFQSNVFMTVQSNLYKTTTLGTTEKLVILGRWSSYKNTLRSFLAGF